MIQCEVTSGGWLYSEVIFVLPVSLKMSNQQKITKIRFESFWEMFVNETMKAMKQQTLGSGWYNLFLMRHCCFGWYSPVREIKKNFLVWSKFETIVYCLCELMLYNAGGVIVIISNLFTARPHTHYIHTLACILFYLQKL